MTQHSPTFASLEDWIACEAISFDMDSPGFDAAVDRLMEMVGPDVQLLGIGEPMHFGEEFLVLRNRLFKRLVERHGFTAIAVESSWPRGRMVEKYVCGLFDSFEEIRDTGFSHGFGALEANRELVEWTRAWNKSDSRGKRVGFYGFDSPTEMMGADSPRGVLRDALEYLALADSTGAAARRERIEGLLGEDAAWENPAAMMDPSKGVGLSVSANALRVEVEELIAELRMRRPDLLAVSEPIRYMDALHAARVGRQMLGYHAMVARPSETRTADLLGARDAMMADNLAYIVEREREAGRGRVLAFAHNSHLKKGKMLWEMRWAAGPSAVEWWPAGAHLRGMLDWRYAVIGVGVGPSEVHGIGTPEAGSLESRLMGVAGPGRIVPTHGGRGIPGEGIVARSGAMKNPTYFGFTEKSFGEYDYVCVLDSCGYSRGAPGR